MSVEVFFVAIGIVVAGCIVWAVIALSSQRNRLKAAEKLAAAARTRVAAAEQADPQEQLAIVRLGIRFSSTASPTFPGELAAEFVNRRPTRMEWYDTASVKNAIAAVAAEHAYGRYEVHSRTWNARLGAYKLDTTFVPDEYVPPRPIQLPRLSFGVFREFPDQD